MQDSGETRSCKIETNRCSENPRQGKAVNQKIIGNYNIIALLPFSNIKVDGELSATT